MISGIIWSTKFSNANTSHKKFECCNLIFVFVFAFLGNISDSLTTLFNVISFLYNVALLLPSLGIAVRRLHDIDFRGWWILIGFVPVIGQLILLVFYVLPSKEPNRF